MRIVSYTRNFEDVILQRVLADVRQGSYIDVGACTPVDDSNTYALYKRGWRGVAIEPLPFSSSWQEARPEDVLLCAAAGRAQGQLTLHVYNEAMQISTGSPEIVRHWQQKDRQASRTVNVPLLTLNQIIAEHLPSKPLHLLSIDVEGMELDVLEGLDLSTHRPWVIILEATTPGSALPNHQLWEPYLLKANYLMAYFDGVNRFYLSQEQSHLLGRFSSPPNVWDNFVTAKQVELQIQVDRLAAQVESLETKLNSRKERASIFDRLRSAARSVAGISTAKTSQSEQDAARLIDRGHALEAESRLDEAMQCYLDAIALAPDSARAHLNRGNVLVRKGDLDGALDAFRTAIKHKPDYAGAYYNIGNALLVNGQPERALISYHRALEIQPDYAEVHCSLGVALKELGQINNAIACFESALEINPELTEARSNLEVLHRPSTK